MLAPVISWLTRPEGARYIRVGWMQRVLVASTRFVWILGRRGVRAANKPLPSGVERCSSGWTRDSRVKGFSNVAEVLGSLTARGAEAWTSGGIRQQSFAIVGHFFRSGEMAFLFPSRSSNLSPERYMEPNDDQPPSTTAVSYTHLRAHETRHD